LRAHISPGTVECVAGTGIRFAAELLDAERNIVPSDPARWTFEHDDTGLSLENATAIVPADAKFAQWFAVRAVYTLEDGTELVDSADIYVIGGEP
jgi:hypothetical protein